MNDTVHLLNIALVYSLPILTLTLLPKSVLLSANGLSQFDVDRPVCLPVCLMHTAAHSCPNMAAPLCREIVGLSKSQLITHRHWHTGGRRGTQCVYVYLWSVKRFGLRSSRPLGRERGERGWVAVRPMGYYLISLGWDPGLCKPDEERRKLNHLLLLRV